MPTTSSAKKRLRQSIKRRDRNRVVKSALKTQIRKTREAAAPQSGEQPPENAGTTFRTTVKKLDQAAAKGVIHRNKAARLKSRLAKSLKQAGVPVAPAKS